MHAYTGCGVCCLSVCGSHHWATANIAATLGHEWCAFFCCLGGGLSSMWFLRREIMEKRGIRPQPFCGCEVRGSGVIFPVLLR